MLEEQKSQLQAEKLLAKTDYSKQDKQRLIFLNKQIELIGF